MGIEQAISRITAAGRQEQVMDLLAGAGRRYGYLVVALGAPPRGNDFNGYFFSTWPQEWLDLYQREELVADDPMALAASVNPMPFLWSDLVAGRAGLTLNEAQMRAPRLAAEHGWREGLCVPIHGPGATVALASFGGTTPDTSLAACTELHILTLHAHVRLSALSRRGERARDGTSPVLTAREAEALACCYAGLTDAGIALTMGVSERTARFHIGNAQEKLGARTRAQAVATALALGLLRN